MSNKGEEKGNRSDSPIESRIPEPCPSTATAIAQQGLRNSSDVSRLAAAVACDVVTGAMKAGEAKAVCAALGTVLRQIDLAYKHGKSKGQAIPVLQISA